MGAKTKIEWATHTFNPWRGCTHATYLERDDGAGQGHPACEHCYAEQLAKRNPATLGKWGDEASGGSRIIAAEKYWTLPAKWNAEAAARYECLGPEEAGPRDRVFCASLADVFEDWRGPILAADGSQVWAKGEIPETLAGVRRRLFETIDATPALDWLLLTKRPENVRRMWPATPHDSISRRPRANVWLGTSISDQATADEWLPRLVNLRDLAPVLFLSVEPLLGPIDLRKHFAHSIRCSSYRGQIAGFDSSLPCDCGRPAIKWVIVGGESGHHARPMHPQWVRDIRDQCQAADVPFFFKQWGEWKPRRQWNGACPQRWGTITRDGHFFATATPFNGHDDDGYGDGEAVMYRVGKVDAGRSLDGQFWTEFPAAVPLTANT